MGSMETVKPTMPIVATSLGLHIKVINRPTTEMAITDIMAMVLDMVVLTPLVIRLLTAPRMVKPQLHITIIITAFIIMAPSMVSVTKHLTMVLGRVMVLGTKHLTMVMVPNMVLVVTRPLTMAMVFNMVPCLMVVGLVMVVITH